jgi:hypothetical protein
VIGVACLVYVYRLPQRCPLVTPWEPPDEETSAAVTT